MCEKKLSEATFIDIFLNWFWKKSEVMWCDGLGDFGIFSCRGIVTFIYFRYKASDIGFILCVALF